jgi:hypothetical protein
MAVIAIGDADSGEMWPRIFYLTRYRRGEQVEIENQMLDRFQHNLGGGLDYAIPDGRNADWHTLPEFCGLVDTLIVDEDGIYDLRQPNDRLLLGMKGTMSEMELSGFRQRSTEAIKRKAQRGEFFRIVAVGYLKTDGPPAEAGEVARVRPGDRRRVEPEKGSKARRRPSGDVVSMASPLPGDLEGCEGSCCHRHRRSRRDLHPQVGQGLQAAC